jgi:alpha-glucosidase
MPAIERKGGDTPWWKSGVLYQVYIRSFADSDGDGVGDLQGVIDHLDHLEWLGIDGLWLSPVTVSPNADWGYDVSDYYDVQPEFGDMEIFDELVSEAQKRRLKVLLDFVPNHTSDEHAWFIESRSSKDSPLRDWYVWADPSGDGDPPNNWVSSTGGSAWTLDAKTGQYFLHNHLVEQPDLNWWNEDVRGAFRDVLEFWLTRGVAGFRIDVCNIIIKDALLRDNPPSTEDDELDVQLMGQRPVYNCNRPEVHEVIRPWRVLADSYEPPKVLIGETPVGIESLAAYYGDGTDELHLAFNFPFINAPLEAAAMRKVVDDTESHLSPGAWPAWTGSNHDMGRFPSRWAGGDERKARVAGLLLLTLRGTPVLYQGDEIAMREPELAHKDLKDPLGVMYYPVYAGRDSSRTPVVWRTGDGAGFTEARSWLPIGPTDRNVADQRLDESSMLMLMHDLITLRRETPDLQTGDYRPIESPGNTWVFWRGKGTLVALNMGALDASIPGIEGSLLISTERERDGSGVDGLLRLSRWEAVVIATLT